MSYRLGVGLVVAGMVVVGGAQASTAVLSTVTAPAAVAPAAKSAEFDPSVQTLALLGGAIAAVGFMGARRRRD